MAFFHRIPREFRAHFVRWTALILLTAVGLTLVGALVGSTYSVIYVTDQNAAKNHREDGQFIVYEPLDSSVTEEIRKEGYTIEKNFYMDYPAEKGATLRVFSDRKSINLAAVEEGSLPKKSDEVLIEKLFAAHYDINVGDKIQIGASDLHVSGIGSLPDYEALFKNFGDIGTDPQKFSVAVMSSEGYTALQKTQSSSGAEVCLYSVLNRDGGSIEDLRTMLRDKSGKEMFLLGFVAAVDNPRINAASEDMEISGVAGMFGGAVFLLLLGYIVSVFLVQTIDRESSVIGALVAMGLSKGELIRHYMVLPAIIGFSGACLGTVGGYLLTPSQYAETMNYYSFPDPQVLFPAVWIAVSLVFPPLICVSVNFIIVCRRLRVSPLSLLLGKKEVKTNRGPKFRGMSFAMRFGIRHAIHEARSAMALLGALFLSLLLVMLAVDCFAAIENLIRDTREDTRFSQMTFLTESLSKIPDDTEAGYAEEFKKEAYGYDVDVTLLGIKSENPYFPFSMPEQEDEVLISTSAMRKFNLATGDTITLREATGDKTRSFRIAGVADYSAGSFLFMNIDAMRELFGREKGYVNVLFSGKSIDLAPEQIANQVSREDIIGYGDIFRRMMSGLLSLLSLTSTIILTTVLYLMQKNVIDRSTYSIALTKTFGYSDKEVQRLYLRFGFVVVVVGSLFLVPLSKIAVDRVFPLMIANVGIGMNTSVPILVYPIIALWILFIYAIVYRLLVGRLKNVSATEILKQRE